MLCRLLLVVMWVCLVFSLVCLVVSLVWVLVMLLGEFSLSFLVLVLFFLVLFLMFFLKVVIFLLILFIRDEILLCLKSISIMIVISKSVMGEGVCILIFCYGLVVYILGLYKI